MKEEIFEPEDDQRQPYNAKTDQVGLIERFLINQHAKQELQGGRYVLENTDYGQRDAPGG